jgi:serine/threonine-protein kinase RsbW
MSHDCEIRLAFPARSGLELVAGETAAEFAACCGAGEAAVGDIRMAVIEACINAIEHAYRDRPADCPPPEVDLRCSGEPVDAAATVPARFRVIVQDHGRGFDLAAYETPTFEKKLHALRKRGWGLHLIRGFMDEVEIRTGSDGTTIEMTKFLVAAGESARG